MALSCLPVELSEKGKYRRFSQALGVRRLLADEQCRVSLGVCGAGFGRLPEGGHFTIQDLPQRILSQKDTVEGQGLEQSERIYPVDQNLRT